MPLAESLFNAGCLRNSVFLSIQDYEKVQGTYPRQLKKEKEKKTKTRIDRRYKTLKVAEKMKQQLYDIWQKNYPQKNTLSKFAESNDRRIESHRKQIAKSSYRLKLYDNWRLLLKEWCGLKKKN